MNDKNPLEIHQFSLLALLPFKQHVYTNTRAFKPKTVFDLYNTGHHYIDVTLDERMLYLMAKNNRPQRQRSEGTGEWAMLNLSLTADERKVFQDTIDNDAHTVEQYIDEQLANGRKFSFSLNRQNEGIIVSLTARDADDTNYGTTLSVYASTYMRGIAALAWADVEIFEAKRWKKRSADDLV